MKMAYNNDWSITEIAGISDLRNSYQWNGEKRLWKWLLLRRINNYSSSNEGRTGTVISNTTPSANSIPQAMTDTAIQKSATRYGGGIRYYAIPGFLVNGQNIIALGGANVEHAAREQAYNHVRMTWGDGQIEPSEIKSWSYFNAHQYPTILLECENFSIDVSTPLFSESDIEDFYINSNKIFLSERNEPLPQFVVYCSPQADLYLSHYSFTQPTVTNTIKATTLVPEYETYEGNTYLKNAVINWNATTSVTGNANVSNFQCCKVKGGYNRIPTQSMKITPSTYTLEKSADKEKVFVTSPSIPFPPGCTIESDYFYLERGTYYYKLDDAIDGMAVLSGVISGSVTTTWNLKTVSNAGFVKLRITYASGTRITNQEIRPILIKRTDDSWINTKWEDVCVVNGRPDFIKDSLFYVKNTALKKTPTHTYSTTASSSEMAGWPAYTITIHGDQWNDLSSGNQHTVKTNVYFTFNVNCNRQRLVPWNIVSTYSESIEAAMDNTVNGDSKYGSWTVTLPSGTNPRTFNKTNFSYKLTLTLPFTPISNTDTFTSGELTVVPNTFADLDYIGQRVTTNTDLFSFQTNAYDKYILIVTQLYRNNYYISEPQCPIVFDEKPAVYFVKHRYSYLIIGSRYSYKPYWGASQISTDTYLDSTLPITFYVRGVAQTVNFPVPTPTGSTTATVDGNTLTWYGPQNSTHPGEIVHPNGFNNSCSLSPYSYDFSTITGGIQVNNGVSAQSTKITGEVKDPGVTYHAFTITTQTSSGTVVTDDSTYTLRYSWTGDTLQLLTLTPVGGGAAYTITTAQNIKFYNN
jgi:hypothetical protein